ncbi:uncharacterized protein LOC108097891 [Drosophila ficusphila]|uniref:uncharacterized protein LOC108097891 n=1 Tax=Drosophila ficusphila TaxID=30025 RepID=UPI0007E6211A|nr:uncharacterized protein LOC108097891 [Drosophila ficusphila]
MDSPVPMAMVPTSLNTMLIPRPAPKPIIPPTNNPVKNILQESETLADVMVSRAKDKVAPPPPHSAWVAPLQREMVEVREALKAQPHGSDFRLLSFVAAASCWDHENTLVPVPPQFQAAPGSGCQVERLRRSVAENWPSSRIMLDTPADEELFAGEYYDELSPDDQEALHLLHWLLVATPLSPTLRRISGLHLRGLCRVLGLARPTLEPGHLLSISYENEEQRFGDPYPKPREQRPSYGFLGLPFTRLYRFLATGNLAYPPGEPIRLYTQPETALLHCEEPVAPPPPPPQEQESPEEAAGQSRPAKKDELCWRNSILAQPQRALVICQLPAELDEPIARLPENHFLEFFVQESAGLRPCYLLLFDEQVATKAMFAWPGRRIELEQKGPSLAQRSRARIQNVAKYLANRLVAVKRAFAAL